MKSVKQQYPGVEEVFGLLQEGEFEKAHKIAKHMPFRVLEEYAKELQCWPPYETAQFLVSPDHDNWSKIEGECKRCAVCRQFILHWQGAMHGSEFICEICESRADGPKGETLP